MPLGADGRPPRSHFDETIRDAEGHGPSEMRGDYPILAEYRDICEEDLASPASLRQRPTKKASGLR